MHRFRSGRSCLARSRSIRSVATGIAGSVIRFRLCEMMTTDKSVQLLDCRSRHFLGLTRVAKRILAKWGVLVEWYAARKAKAEREGSEVPEFPLDGQQELLIQLLSV